MPGQENFRSALSGFFRDRSVHDRFGAFAPALRHPRASGEAALARFSAKLLS